MIRDQSKDKQIFQNTLYSEDMLIRSTKENVSQTIPFIQLMGRFVH